MRLCGAQYVGDYPNFRAFSWLRCKCCVFIDGKLLTAMGNAFVIPFLPLKLHETNLIPKSFLWIYALIPKSFVAKFGLIPKSLGCLPTAGNAFG